MKEIKEFQQNALNQSKYWYDHARNNTGTFFITEGNIVDFKKEMIRQNPMNSMQYTWQEAQMRKMFVFWCTLPFIVGHEYWKTFHEVYRYPATAPTNKED